MKKILILSNEELALRTKELLNKNNIPCTVEGTDIYVPEEQYDSSLKRAIEVLENKDLQDAKTTATSALNCLWTDAYGDEHELGWLTIFYGSLPNGREGNSSWDYADCPMDFRGFLFLLNSIVISDVPSCDTREIVMDYHKENNAFEFSVPGKMNDFEKIQAEIRKYVEKYQASHPENTPFERIHWTSPIGTWDKPVKKEETHSKLYSYLSHSYFLRSLKHPEEECVRCYNRKGNSFGYQSTRSSYQTRRIEISPSLLQPGVREGYDGNFIVTSSKVFDRYVNQYKGTTHLNFPEQFTMIDNGTFKSYVSYNMEQDQIDVRTMIDLTRSTVGYDFDKKGLRDAIFKNVPQSDYQGRVEVNEHFKTFANGTKLVHFVDDSEYCEIYDLPINWNPFQGVESLEGYTYPSWRQISPKMDDYDSVMASLHQAQSTASQGHSKILKK